MSTQILPPENNITKGVRNYANLGNFSWNGREYEFSRRNRKFLLSSEFVGRRVEIEVERVYAPQRGRYAWRIGESMILDNGNETKMSGSIPFIPFSYVHDGLELMLNNRINRYKAEMKKRRLSKV